MNSSHNPDIPKFISLSKDIIDKALINNDYKTAFDTMLMVLSILNDNDKLLFLQYFNQDIVTHYTQKPPTYLSKL
jgi:hypothetical protein